MPHRPSARSRYTAFTKLRTTREVSRSWSMLDDALYRWKQADIHWMVQQQDPTALVRKSLRDQSLLGFCPIEDNSDWCGSPEENAFQTQASGRMRFLTIR